MRHSYVIIFVVTFIAASKQHDPPEVKIDQGLIRGKISSAEDGTKYNSFINIPYAKPPLGELRFKDPQPADNWDGILEADKETKVCAQYDTIISDMELGVEDCLILNVHTPADVSSRSELLPVMFWVHGGGFYSGSSSDSFYGGEYFVKRDVVFVSTNYRLGPLGFLNMNTPEVPGNAGLKDIVLALKWVSKNIQKFGGDPNRVTIFGESAGSAAVHYLIASPLAKGLFHRAICQSGVILNPWSIQRNPEKSVQRLVKALDIKADSPNEILAELNKIPASEIVRAVPVVFHKQPLELPFAVTVEKKFPGVDSIFTRDPLQIFIDGDHNICPTIVGFNNNEGILPLFRWLKDHFKADPTPEDFVSNFEEVMPHDIAEKLRESGGNIGKVAEDVKNLYFNSDRDKFQRFADLAGDMMFTDGVNLLMNIMVKHSPVYFYNFVYNGERNAFKKLTSYKYEGASHFDDVGYLFHMVFFNEASTSPRDFKMMNYMQKLWTDFVKGEIPADWTPATKEKFNCLVIDENPKMVEAPFSKTIYFWENLRKSLNMYN